MAALRREMAADVLVEHDPGQRQRVPFAPARVRIGLPDQGLDVLAAASPATDAGCSRAAATTCPSTTGTR